MVMCMCLCVGKRDEEGACAKKASGAKKTLSSPEDWMREEKENQERKRYTKRVRTMPRFGFRMLGHK